MLCDNRDFLYQASEEDLALYLKMIPKDHRLLKALHVIDFEQLIPELIAGYSPSRGQPAIPPILAFKWELLKYWYNLSDRSVMERTETDVAFRYLLQFPICFWPPAHTLLTRFRGRLGEEGYRRVFQRMVAQARGHGLVKDQLRLKDATHILANISIPSTLALAAQVREGLIESLQGIDPEVAEGYRIATEQLRQQNADQVDATRLARRVELIGDIVQSAKEIPQDAKLTRRQKLYAPRRLKQLYQREKIRAKTLRSDQTKVLHVSQPIPDAEGPSANATSVLLPPFDKKINTRSRMRQCYYCSSLLRLTVNRFIERYWLRITSVSASTRLLPSTALKRKF